MADGTFRTSDGATIAYTVHARPGAPRVALLHSLALDRSIWDGVVERLGKHAEILTFDFRGHGRSERRAGAAKAKGMRSLIDFQLTRWFSDKYRAENPEMLERIFGIFVAGDVDCYASSCALLGDADIRGALAGFRMPVAIVVGEEDYATPIAMSQAMKDAIPQATMKILMGGRHLTPIQCPDEISSELVELLARV